ncbi:MAG: molybdenum cofactor biosynthesis protein MoaE [Candidatus Omnitrophica bacterium]|nr:molybdenum cofactor biosynthesis protein MoaE [Candidatus Omnitrophota bacterium]
MFLTRDPIDPSAWHRGCLDAKDGASVEFLGVVRGEEDGRPITHLNYEAYEPMADRLIKRWVQEAARRWGLHRVFLLHRVGPVAVGEAAVAIGVQAAHREEAFEACRFLIERIKEEAPIWKKPVLPL